MTEPATFPPYPEFAHQLAAILARIAREDREAIGATLRRYIRGVDWEREEARAISVFRGSGKWTSQPSSGRSTIDFSYASPISDKRRQSDGIRLPHFDVKRISRVVVPRSRSGATHHRYPDRSGIAAGHHKYVTDGGIAAYKTHFDYIMRLADPEKLEEDPYLIADILDLEDDRHLRNNLAVLSNIPGGLDRQRSLFEAAERCERQAHGGKLLVSTEYSGAWTGLAVRSGAPEWVLEAARLLAEARAKVEASARRKKRKAKHRRIAICKVDLEGAYDRLSWCDEQWGTTSKALPDFKAGPCGRIQTRFVFELPRGLDPYAHRQIMEEFCALLEKEGWMFVAAIHRPDVHNDPENFHVHVDAYDRPATWLDEHGCWDFEYRERKRNGKFRYPDRQNKIEVARSVDGKVGHRAHGKTYLESKRAAYVTIANKVIADNGGVQRYVAGTYKDNGIDLRPLSHLGNRIIANEKRGIVTSVGSANARIMFDDELRRIRREMTLQRWLIRRKAREMVELVGSSAAARAVRKWHRLRNHVLIRRCQASMFDVVMTMARSRADTVIRHGGAKNGQAIDLAKFWVSDIKSIAPTKGARDAQEGTLAALDGAAASQLKMIRQLAESEHSTLAYQSRSAAEIASVSEGHEGMVRGRLVAWLDTHERDPSRLVINGGAFKLGPTEKAPSIDRLFRLFAQESTIQRRIVDERDRRAAAATIPNDRSDSKLQTERPSTLTADQPTSSKRLVGSEPRRRGVVAQGRASDASVLGSHATGPVRAKGPKDQPGKSALSTAKPKRDFMGAPRSAGTQDPRRKYVSIAKGPKKRDSWPLTYPSKRGHERD